jgi:hypothetical protein
MPSFKEGDRVRVKRQPSSLLHGKTGTVLRAYNYGLAIVYEVSFEKFLRHLSPAAKFYEYDLELAG